MDDPKLHSNMQRTISSATYVHVCIQLPKLMTHILRKIAYEYTVPNYGPSFDNCLIYALTTVISQVYNIFCVGVTKYRVHIHTYNEIFYMCSCTYT